MPFIVADLWKLPSPFSRLEGVEVSFSVVTSQEEDETAIAYKHRHVMSVHLVVISVAQNVFLGVLISIWVGLVFKPGGDGEGRGEVMVENGFWDNSSR